MIVRFIIPDEAAEKINGFLRNQVYKLSYRENHPATEGTNGAGALFHGEALFTREKFRAGRNHLGAVLVAKNKAAVCAALGVELSEDGIIQGYTESEWALFKSDSRQNVHQKVKRGTLKAKKIGPMFIISEQEEVI